MQSRSRNQNEKAERREALLNAAQVVFSEKGFEHTSMDDIANQAGFSRALLYVYFKDKKDIHRSLKIRSVKALRDRMLAHIDLGAAGIVRVRQVGEAFYQFYRHDKDHFDCLSLDISLNNQSTLAKNEVKRDPEAMAAEEETMQIMVNSLLAGVKDGSIDPNKVSNPLQTAMFLRGSLHGVILLQDEDGSALLDSANIDKQELVEYALDIVCNGLKPSADGPRVS
jgi:AcrR family transcriptional regulator